MVSFEHRQLDFKVFAIKVGTYWKKLSILKKKKNVVKYLFVRVLYNTVRI